MQDVGFAHSAADPEERPATQWYHDNLLDFTGANVQRGLAGALLVFDEFDTGDENLATAENLHLPSLLRSDSSLPGFDAPLIFSDRMIAPDGSLVYLPESFDGFIGDKRMLTVALIPSSRWNRGSTISASSWHRTRACSRFG